VVELFYGWPDPDLVSAAHSLGALACWQVGSVEEAVAAQQAGCELIAVQGVEAGGHVRGTLSLRELLPAVLREVDAVVIAGGGLGDAADVAELMALGAHAVRVGTRFIPCAESAAHPGYVAALAAAADGEDTVLTGHFDEGWPDAPHRVLRIAEQAARQSGNRSVLPPTRGVAGDVAGRAMYAGCGVGAVKGPTDALTVVRELMRGVA
jgi:NAD(P)H-dependent flavin oxidoreductase YrpB (nitropropane dioxygenase family)